MKADFAKLRWRAAMGLILFQSTVANTLILSRDKSPQPAVTL